MERSAAMTREEKREASAREALDAIRLAVEGAANNQAAVTVIRTILADGPPADKKSTESVRRLLRAIKRTRYARFRVQSGR